MFMEIHFPTTCLIDRDDIEDALVEVLGDHLEITGAGVGAFGTNLDVEFDSGIDQRMAVAEVGLILVGLGVSDARIRAEGETDWIEVEVAAAGSECDDPSQR